jgi:hypothetical protein
VSELELTGMIEDTDAYWIGPDGKILSNFRLHIQAVIDNPESFGVTENDVKESYAKYQEPMGFEGNARQELMEQVIARGWIRIRYNPKTDQFSIELDRLDTGKKEYLFLWANELLKINQKRKYTEVRIMELVNAMNVTLLSLTELAQKVLQNSAIQ